MAESAGRILAVDDDEMTLVVIRKILEAEQFVVDALPSAREALAQLGQARYDAVLVDMWMPGMSGNEFYQRVKKDFPEYRSRIIFMTGDVASEATWDFIDERRLPYIIKPFSLPELRKKLREVIGERPVEARPPSWNTEQAEQRRHRRIPIKASVRIRKKKWATGGPDVATTLNYCKEGLYFVTDRPYRVGTEILVSFPYTGSSCDTEQEGCVVRVEGRGNGQQGVAVALGEAAETARQGTALPVEERRRRDILEMANLAVQAPVPAELTSPEVREAAELQEKMARERREARRVAEELADLKSTSERISAQRDRLASEEVHLNLQLRELAAAKAAMTQAVEDLKGEIDGLQQRLAAGEAFKFQATHDSLTGLLNRPAVLDILRREMQRGLRERTPVGLVIADLDHFKRVNDTYGHMAGDAVLVEAAKRMGSSVRAYDSVGRFGGEEFLIVLPGCDANATYQQAERIRASIANEPVTAPEGSIAVTVSMGAASSAAEADMDALLRAADTALYAAKRAGRNRVERAVEGKSPDGSPSAGANCATSA